MTVDSGSPPVCIQAPADRPAWGILASMFPAIEGSDRQDTRDYRTPSNNVDNGTPSAFAIFPTICTDGFLSPASMPAM